MEEVSGRERWNEGARERAEGKQREGERGEMERREGESREREE